MSTGLFITTVVAALGSGIMAGLFFAFSAFIMQALTQRSAPVAIAAMQSINTNIQNPVFFAVFFGTALLSVLLAVLAVLHWDALGSGWRLLGALLYLVGAIAITVRWNVPLNNRLDQANPEGADGAAVWAHYMQTWLPWNHARTVGCTAATASFILSL